MDFGQPSCDLNAMEAPYRTFFAAVVVTGLASLYLFLKRGYDMYANITCKLVEPVINKRATTQACRCQEIKCVQKALNPGCGPTTWAFHMRESSSRNHPRPYNLAKAI